MKATRTLKVILMSTTAIGLATLSAAAQTNPPGLVSLWAAQGDPSDSVGTNHGLLHGGVTFSAGRVGLAFALDGTTGYVDVPDSPSLDLRSNATLMAWVYLEELPSQAGRVMHVLGKSQLNNDLDFQVETDDRIHFYIGPGSTVSSLTVLQTSIWYHVVATYKANSQIQLFINGVREASASISVTRAANSNPLTIGWNVVFPGRFLHGRIDQVRVFDAVSSEDRIADIFTVESGLVRARIYPAAEVCWSSRTNENYQLQWVSSLDSTNWVNLGTPLQGTGTTMCILDSTRAQEKQFYRLQVVP